MVTGSRRPRGEAAQTILNALRAAEGHDLRIVDLRTRTGLPEPTLRDNVAALRRRGQVETFRDDESLLWVALPE